MKYMVTKTDVKNAFKTFAKEAGIPINAKWYKNKREYSRRWLKLDYNPHYGGYRLDWVNKDTTESFFSGMSRRNTRQMYEYLQGLIQRGRINKGGKMKTYHRFGKKM